MEFYSRYNRPATIPAPECPKERPIYIEKIDKHGHTYLEETGKEPFYDNIQKFKDECDVYTILKRYEAGDPNIVARLDKAFPDGHIDISNFPTNLIDLKNLLGQAEVLFDCLTPTERSSYDNNVNVFLSKLSNGEVPETLKNIITQKTAEPVVEQPKADAPVEGVKYE